MGNYTPTLRRTESSKGIIDKAVKDKAFFKIDHLFDHIHLGASKKWSKKYMIN